MITGDIFTPAPLTPDAAKRISRLAGHKGPTSDVPVEPLRHNPSPPYPLDPDRGVPLEDSTSAIVAEDVSEPTVIVETQDSGAHESDHAEDTGAQKHLLISYTFVWSHDELILFLLPSRALNSSPSSPSLPLPLPLPLSKV